jgi:glutathione S-transferase
VAARAAGLPYGIKFYKRDVQTNGAPEELKAVHPLGRSPIITDGGKAVTESAAIIDYVIRHYDGGRLQPDVADPAYDDYAEGSAIQPVVLKVNAARIGEGAAAIEARIERELANDLGYIDRCLGATTTCSAASCPAPTFS